MDRKLALAGESASTIVELSSGDGAELRKPHEMIVLVPRSGRVTLTGRRTYNAMLRISQQDMQALPEMPKADFLFWAPLQQILRATGSSGDERTAAKRYLREMKSLEVDWESTAPGNGPKWSAFNMLAEVQIELRNGENWVGWSFPPTIMAALRDPSRWARIDLEVLANLSTYTAVALYEICARYRDNPGGVTSKKPPGWWVDALSQTPPGTEPREWRKLKSEKVKAAVDEINSATDLAIELIEHKAGRTVSEVQFKVQRRRLERPALRHDDRADADLVLRAESLGIRESKLDGLLKEFGDASVRVQLEALEERKRNAALRGVDNAYSYLRSLLRNEGLGPSVGGQGGFENAPLSQPRNAAAAFGAGAALPAAPSGQEAAVLWAKDRDAQMRREIQALEPQVRQAIVDRALERMQEAGMLSAVVSRRAEQGDILFGSLGGWVVRLYGESVYGSSWNTPPTDKNTQ
jgi:hypothetical protein